MLTTKKNITITGTSEITGKQAAYLNATVSTGSGNSNVNQSITDEALYAANKAEVRKDIADFQALVYEKQDALTAAE